MTAKLTRDNVINEARSWLGTPFQHQGRLKNVGCDCIGLVIAINKKFKITEYDRNDYARYPSLGLLEKELRAHLVEVPREKVRYGDVLLMRVKRDPQHVAILTKEGNIIHAYQGSKKVIEVPFQGFWENRVTHCFSFPGIQA